MAVEAESRRGLGEMIIELLLALLTNLVGRVTSLATHIERSVTAAGGGNVKPLCVAGQAEIVILGRTRGWLQQLEL